RSKRDWSSDVCSSDLVSEQRVEEAAQDLVDDRFLGREVMVEAAREDPRRVGDIAHGGGAQAVFGEEAGGERQELLTAGGARHEERIPTKHLLGGRTCSPVAVDA